MKQFYIFLFTVLSIPSMNAYNYSLMHHLETMHIESLFQNNENYGLAAQKAFKSFHKLSKTLDSQNLLHHDHITNLFSLNIQKSQNSELNDSLNNLQNLMLVYLYAKLFNDYIKKSEILIEQVVSSLNYWKKEMFYDQLPNIRKHPIYWFHSPARKKLVRAHVKTLEILKQETTTLLGIALHGRYELSNIQDNCDVCKKLCTATIPLFQYFHSITRNRDITESAEFQDMLWLHENLEQTLKSCQKSLTIHQKPHHIIQHGFFYSCAVLTIIAAYATYKMHEDEMPEYKRKSTEALNNFWKEYIKIPFQDIKETLWDNKSKELGTLESCPNPAENIAPLCLEPWPNPAENIAPLSLAPWPNPVSTSLNLDSWPQPVDTALKLDPWPKIDNLMLWTIQKDLNKVIDVTNQNKHELEILINNFAKNLNAITSSSNQNKKELESLINNFTANLNSMTNASNQNKKELESFINNLMKIVGGIINASNQNKKELESLINNIIKIVSGIINALNQNKKEIEFFINDWARKEQLTMALAAIAPAALGCYGIYRFSNHTYNKYIKHESWHKPMKLILREMDKILTKLITTQEFSYADDGMLHILILQLKTFIFCLPNEELQLMQQDLYEFSDFSSSYEQKRGILQRMHQTYEFLN